MVVFIKESALDFLSTVIFVNLSGYSFNLSSFLVPRFFYLHINFIIKYSNCNICCNYIFGSNCRSKVYIFLLFLHLCFLGVRNKMHAVVLKSSRYRIFGLIKFFRGSTISQAKQLIDVVVYDIPGVFRFNILYNLLSLSLNFRLSILMSTTA